MIALATGWMGLPWSRMRRRDGWYAPPPAQPMIPRF
jgi:hypothetical protein